MRNPEWKECRTCDGRDLCHDEETLEKHGMSGQRFYELVTEDTEALAFFEERADELLELQQRTGMDTRWMILHGLHNGAVWAFGRQEMGLFAAIRRRRSVRQFLPEAVPEKDLERILEAARWAPTAGNNQPWQFLVVKDRDNLEQLRDRLQPWVQNRMESLIADLDKRSELQTEALSYLDQLFAAPVMIFLFVNTDEHPEWVPYDGALAAANLMLAARALGYGTSFQTSFFPAEVVGPHFGVPDRFQLICAIPLGRPAAWPDPPEKKPLEELVRREQWRQR